MSNNFEQQKQIKKIVDSFDFDTPAEKKIQQQKQEMFDKWENGSQNSEKEINPIKKTLKVHIDRSKLKTYILRNIYPSGVDFYVNKDIGKILKPFEFHGKTSVIQTYDGRKFVIAKVDGRELPFYSSSQGTAGKEKGGWYPFYGFSEQGWVMKDSFDKEGNWIYNKEADKDLQEKIRNIADQLTKNISLPFIPNEYIDNLNEYFEYQEIPDTTDRKYINNALGLPEDIDTKNISTHSGHDELEKIKKFLLKKISNKN